MSLFLQGKVSKVNGCNATVCVTRSYLYPKYGKRVQRTTKILAHDELGVKVGDEVSLKLCAPISKSKRHKIEVVK